MKKNAFRIRPELRSYEPVTLAGQLLNLYVVLLGIPLGLASVIWLWAVSDLQVIRWRRITNECAPPSENLLETLRSLTISR